MVGVEDLERVCGELGIPREVLEEAKVILGRVYSDPSLLGELRGYTRADIAAAAVYLASLRTSTPLSLLKLRRLLLSLASPYLYRSGVSAVRRAARRIAARLGLRVWATDGWVSEACRRLGLPEEVRSRALELLPTITRGSPRTKAALAVWLAARELGVEVTVSGVCRAVGITPQGLQSLRRRLKKIPSVGSAGKDREV